MSICARNLRFGSRRVYRPLSSFGPKSFREFEIGDEARPQECHWGCNLCARSDPPWAKPRSETEAIVPKSASRAATPWPVRQRVQRDCGRNKSETRLPYRGLQRARAGSMLSNCRIGGRRLTAPADRLTRHSREPWQPGMPRQHDRSSFATFGRASTGEEGTMARIMRQYPRVAAVMIVALATAGVALAQQASVVGTLEGHTDPVYAVAWSPDGKTIATASFDNTVRLWDAATRKEIKKFEGHSKLVLTVAFSPDGKHVLSGSQDNTAKIWDMPTSGPTKTFRRPCRRIAGAGGQARRQAVRRRVGQVGQDLGPGDWQGRQGSRRPRRRRAKRRLARRRSTTRHRRQGTRHPPLESRPDARRRDRDAHREHARPGLPAQ